MHRVFAQVFTSSCVFLKRKWVKSSLSHLQRERQMYVFPSKWKGMKDVQLEASFIKATENNWGAKNVYK